MSTYNIDTEQLREANTSINNYINDINGLLHNLTKRIENMPTLTKEWQGNSADAFAEIVKEQKEKEFNPFMIKLQAYSNALKNIAEDFDKVERNTKL